MKQTKNTAFTLVELIVVITILAVLATVAFISFQGYTSSSRDSVRLADLKNISKSFELMKTKDQELPLPDKKVDISNSGTIFQYQGVLEEQTLKLSNIHNGGLDPLTGDPYGYSVNTQRNKFQLIGFLENNQSISQNLISNSFADNSDKFIKSAGDALGVILDETTKEIILDEANSGNIDIQTNTSNYSIFVDKKVVTGNNDVITGEIDFRFNKIKDCRAILLNGNSQGSGEYTINPTGNSGDEMQVYCDMKSNGGGWTRVSTQINDNAHRLRILDLVESDSYTDLPRADDCIECGAYPKYYFADALTNGEPNILGKYICKDILYGNKSYENIEIHLTDELATHTGKNGLFLGNWTNTGLFYLRGESDTSYNIYSQVYCR